MENYTPQEIVKYLDKYIIGQEKAKKSVALALRNRYRRKLLPPEIQDDIMPKNIILIGPTGVGKTEIARRIAKLVKAPFVKVEATKFTEVGYVGRDVESMIRDLVETSIRIVKNEMIQSVQEKALEMANHRLLDILVPAPKKESPVNPLQMFFGNTHNSVVETSYEEQQQEENNLKKRREDTRKKLLDGLLEDYSVEVEVEESASPTLEIFSGSGMEDMGINLQNILGGMLPKKTKKRKLPVKEARKILQNEEAQKLIDHEEVTRIAVKRAEESGIVFLDEIDKIAGKESGGPDVSRGGVQRDILPIVEGSTIMTKYGPVKTDYILFIAAGAFHVSKPSDLIPELQGRFPIRVELESLSKRDFGKILTEPKNSLIKQYTALLGTEGVKVIFAEDGIEEIALMAFKVNEDMENIGARRLHTLLEKILEDISFSASELKGTEVTVDKNYVKQKLANVIEDEDLSKYIL